MATKYFSLQGIVRFGKRLSNGDVGAVRDAMNAPKLDLAIEVSEENKKESRSGQRLVDAVIETGKEVKVSLSLDSFDLDNLAMALYGAKFTRVAGSVTNELLPTGLVAGNQIKLDRERVSAVVLTDSAGTPATLVDGTHYRVVSAFAGVVEILNPGTFVQPFKAAYSYAETNSVALFSAPPEEQYLLFDGLNTAQQNAPVYVELYRVKFKPASSLPLINEAGFATLELEGTALYDGTKPADPSLGYFGRLVMAGAT